MYNVWVWVSLTRGGDERPGSLIVDGARSARCTMYSSIVNIALASLRIILKVSCEVVSVQCTQCLRSEVGGLGLVSAPGIGTSPLLLLARQGEYICLIFASIMSGCESVRSTVIICYNTNYKSWSDGFHSSLERGYRHFMIDMRSRLLYQQETCLYSVWLFSVENVFITFHVGVNQWTGKLKIAQSCFQSIRNFDRQFAWNLSLSRPVLE